MKMLIWMVHYSASKEEELYNKCGCSSAMVQSYEEALERATAQAKKREESVLANKSYETSVQVFYYFVDFDLGPNMIFMFETPKVTRITKDNKIRYLNRDTETPLE